MRRRIFLFCLLLVQLAGLSLFLKGFFPVKKALSGSASSNNLPPEPGSTDKGYGVPAVFDRLVFVLVDALKADFIFNDTRMVYTKGLIDKNDSISVIALAHSPTVTMPRIKALMTGGIPSFIDFLFNSVSTALKEDNLVTQMFTAGKTIVFFGDDTWLKLFPRHFWRKDGTTSFFVTDYTEVDNNVTRHLEKELQSTDWDIMVLHYLGLDHIGHLAGPSSPLVGPKLQEMDYIIQKIHRNLLKNDNERGSKSLLVICGDHGMSDSGSHGGASLPETLTPFVLLGSRFQNGQGLKFSEMMVDQIDVASTLATILGLPIPQNSVGHVIPDLLMLYSPRDKLRALQLNAKQLTKVLQANGHQPESNWELEEAYRLHQRWLESLKANKQDQNTLTIQSEQVVKQYMKAITGMSDQITASLSCYDLHAMVSGIAILVQVLGWLVSIGFRGSEESRKIFSIGDSIPSASWLFMFGACLMVAVAIHLSICSSTLATGTCSSDILCSKQSSSVIFSLILIIFSSLSLSSVSINTIPSFLCNIVRQSGSIICCPIKSLLVFGTSLHIFSLLSSSFVEEEHQTWYFLIKTYFIVSFCVSIKRCLYQRKPIPANQRELTVDYQDEIKNCSTEQLMENRFNVHSFNNFARQAESFIEEKNMKSCVLQEKPGASDCENETLVSLLGPLFCLVLVRISRTWNQTGIKWSHLPDVGDWLTLPENQLMLSLVSIASLCVILFCTFKRTDFITSVIQSVGLMFVYNYRVATGTVWLPWTTSKPNTLGLTEARMAYGCSFVLLVISVIRFLRTLRFKSISEDYFVMYKSKLEEAVKTFFAGFVVVVALVTRAHSFFVLAVFVVQQCCLERFLSSSKANANSWTTYLVYFWFGHVAYFTLGKSNSLTTVDLAAAYIGLQAHDDVAVTCLLIISTYSGPLLWMAALLHRVVKDSTSQKQLYDGLYDMCVMYTLPQSLLLCVYTTLVYSQRYHLFVWSVFSPKLMFETVRTVVMLMSIGIVLVTSALVGRTVHLNKTD